MILGPISLVDCGVFLIFLAPQLIWHAGFFLTLFTGLKALPFLRWLSLTTYHASLTYLT